MLTNTLREKCPNMEFFLVRVFRHSDWIRRDTKYLSVFSPNAGKYGPEKTPYLDTFTQWIDSIFSPQDQEFSVLILRSLWLPMRGKLVFYMKIFGLTWQKFIYCEKKQFKFCLCFRLLLWGTQKKFSFIIS